MQLIKIIKASPKPKIMRLQLAVCVCVCVWKKDVNEKNTTVLRAYTYAFAILIYKALLTIILRPPRMYKQFKILQYRYHFV